MSTRKNKNHGKLAPPGTLLFHNKKGVTLVELIVAIGIFVIIAGGISVFLVQGFNLYGSELKTNANEGDIRNAMTHIVESLRKTVDDSTGITVDSANKLTVSGKVYTVNSGNLVCNTTILIKDVTEFKVVKTSSIIDISITAAGKTLSTSYAMK